EIEGGLFLNNFLHAFLKSGAGIPKPEEPLPVEDLAAKVAEMTTEFAKGLEKQPQTPKLAGSVLPDGAAYDPAEAAAPRVVIPKLAAFAKGGLADAALIKSIFAEIKCPPIKATSPDQA